MTNSPYQIYKQASVQTAGPEQLIIMLYDGAIRFIKAGISGVQTGNFEHANNNFQKCQSIINELIASLNMDFPVSKELIAIYEYMLHLTIQANIKKEVSSAEEVLGYLEELRETWKDVIKSSPSITQQRQGAEYDA